MHRHTTRKDLKHALTTSQTLATQVTDKEIARRAFELYLESGCREGDSERNWRQAERELLAGGRAARAAGSEVPQQGGESSSVHDSDIARRAFEIYVDNGFRQGECEQNWRQAERDLWEIRRDIQKAAQKPPQENSRARAALEYDGDSTPALRFMPARDADGEDATADSRSIIDAVGDVDAIAAFVASADHNGRVKR